MKKKNIDRILSKKKKVLLDVAPMCIVCHQRFLTGDSAELMHKIRRSDRSDKYSNFDLQTMDRNIGLAHGDCHHIWDNGPVYNKIRMPGYLNIMNDIMMIDQNIAIRYMENDRKSLEL